MNNQSEREAYVEREYKKWEEQFVIPFEQEFNIKALLGLRHQFNNTSDEHIKTKVDLLHAMKRLQEDMNLKPKLRSNDKNDMVNIKHVLRHINKPYYKELWEATKYNLSDYVEEIENWSKQQFRRLTWEDSEF